MIFCFEPPEFDLGYLMMSVTGLDRPPIFENYYMNGG